MSLENYAFFEFAFVPWKWFWVDILERGLPFGVVEELSRPVEPYPGKNILRIYWKYCNILWRAKRCFVG